MNDSKRKYSRRLTEEETINFIRSRIRLNDKFINKAFSKKAAWKAVAEDCGLNIEVEQMSKKWSNLILTYKKILNLSTVTGTDEGEWTIETWPYFKEMYKYASINHDIYPIKLLSSRVVDVSCNNNENTYTSNLKTERSRTSSSSSSSPRQESRSSSQEKSPVPKKKKEDPYEELLKSNIKLTKKMTKILKGVSTVMSEKFGVNINLDSSSSSDDE